MSQNNNNTQTVMQTTETEMQATRNTQLASMENTEIQNNESTNTQNDQSAPKNIGTAVPATNNAAMDVDAENNDMDVEEEPRATNKPANKAGKISENINKGKGKATAKQIAKKAPAATEAEDDDMNVDSEKEDDAPEKTKKNSKTEQTTKGDATTKGKKKALRGKVMRVKKGDVQSMVEGIHEELHKATIGYALMTIHDTTDLGRGPSIITQSINSRALNMKYIKEFGKRVKSEGLHNKMVENAIVVGIRKEWIKLDSVQPIRGGIYDNCVEWIPRHFSNTDHSILFNGNHRMHYMQTNHASRNAFQLYSTAKKELKTCTDAKQKAYLQGTVDRNHTVITTEGVWLVKFVNLAMIEASDDCALLEHHLATNIPLPNLEDSDDDKVAQVLMIMSGLSVEERRTYVKNLLLQLASNTSLYKILKDEGLYTAAMKLFAWRHFKGVGTGVGLSAQHLASWNPLMQQFANHMSWTLRFLSLPLRMPTLGSVDREAAKTEKDQDDLRKSAAELIFQDIEEASTIDMQCDCVSTLYLDAWAKEFVNHVTNANEFHKFASLSQIERTEYTHAMDTYWLRVRAICGQVAKEAPQAGHPDWNKDWAMVVENMERKIDWLRTGLLTDGHGSLDDLPLPNKFVLPAILKLYSNEKISLDNILLEIGTWVDPLMRLVLEQRHTQKAAQSAGLPQTYTNVTSALFDYMGANEVGVREIFSLLVESRNSVLLPAAIWSASLPFSQMKLEADFITPELLAAAKESIRNYKSKIIQHQKQSPCSTRPPPTKFEAPEELKDRKHAKVIDDILHMLQYTALPWERQDILKRPDTAIKYLTLVSRASRDRKRLLATKDGWKLRTRLGDIVKHSAQVNADEMSWWDQIDKQPVDEDRLDQQSMVTKIKGESKGNRMLRIGHVEEIRAKNIAAVKKVADTVLTEHLGLLKPGLVSPSIATALLALQEAMQIQSEKHLAQLENPRENLAGVVFHGTRLAEIEREYSISMPPIATEEAESAFWSPITDTQQLKPITHLEPSKSTDHKALEKELRDRASIAAAMEKLKKEQQKVVLYSRKTQAKMVAKQQVLDNSEEEEDHAIVKKMAEARQARLLARRKAGKSLKSPSKGKNLIVIIDFGD
ncbi:hypothetical protein BU15DRAFT_76175 [Melanogaster broomeanus]|nr:hypothetical protein BU15DRAFT_76175 [Melanogaster broomeanus]